MHADFCHETSSLSAIHLYNRRATTKPAPLRKPCQDHVQRPHASPPPRDPLMYRHDHLLLENLRLSLLHGSSPTPPAPVASARARDPFCGTFRVKLLPKRGWAIIPMFSLPQSSAAALPQKLPPHRRRANQLAAESSSCEAPEDGGVGGWEGCECLLLD